MKTIFAILEEEHQNILKVIKALIQECEKLETGKEIDQDFFKTVIDFIKGYADKFHHAKEEDILFIELSRDEAQMHCNPIEQMLYEHNLGRDFIKGLTKAVEEKNKNKVIENAKAYGQLLKDHIFKEDNMLYRMADQALGHKAKAAILDKFQKIEQKFTQEKARYLFFARGLK